MAKPDHADTGRTIAIFICRLIGNAAILDRT